MSLISRSTIDKITGVIRKKFSKFVTTVQYDFWESMRSNEIAKSSNPRLAANKWFKEYAKNPEHQYKNRVMRPGLMYTYKYDAKHKDTLEYWDRRPLVVCLGNYRTQAGKVREIGVNLHMLPQKVRVLVLYQIYYMMRLRYKANIYSDKQKAVPMSWKVIARPLKQFGIGFAIRQYIPNRKTSIIEIKQDDWERAVYYNPNVYEGINAKALEAEWRKFVQKQKLGLVKGEGFLK